MPQHQLVAKSTPTHKFISFIPRDKIGVSWSSLVPNQSQEIAQNTPITATFYLALYSMTKIMLQRLKFSPSHKSFLLIPRNSGYHIFPSMFVMGSVGPKMQDSRSLWMDLMDIDI